MLGVVENDHSDFILIERETFKMGDVTSTFSILTHFMRDFTKEWFLNSYTKWGRCVLHHLESFVSLVVILCRVDHRPLLFLKVGGLSVLHFASGVVIPASLAPVSKQRWGIEDFTSDLMLNRPHIDFEFPKLLSFQELVDDGYDAFKALFGMWNLELLEVFHLARVWRKVLRERGFTAHFGGQVYSCVTEVNEQQGLIGLLDL